MAEEQTRKGPALTVSRKEEAKHELETKSKIVCDWMQDLLKQPIPGKNLQEKLSDGVILCQLANAIKPGCIRKYHRKPKMLMMKIENIAFFLAVCKSRFGVPQESLFSPQDIHEKTEDGEEDPSTMLRVLTVLFLLIKAGGYSVAGLDSIEQFHDEPAKTEEGGETPTPKADTAKEPEPEPEPEPSKEPEPEPEPDLAAFDVRADNSAAEKEKAEKEEAERKAAEDAERKRVADEKAAEEKRQAEEKAAQEKAAQEKKDADAKAALIEAAEKKKQQAEAEEKRQAEEKAAKEKAAKEEADRIAADKRKADDLAAQKKEEEAKKIAAEKAAAEKKAAEEKKAADEKRAADEKAKADAEKQKASATSSTNGTANHGSWYLNGRTSEYVNIQADVTAEVLRVIHHELSYESKVSLLRSLQAHTRAIQEKVLYSSDDELRRLAYDMGLGDSLADVPEGKGRKFMLIGY